jgi:hypothetical protein
VLEDGADDGGLGDVGQHAPAPAALATREDVLLVSMSILLLLQRIVAHLVKHLVLLAASG